MSIAILRQIQLKWLDRTKMKTAMTATLTLIRGLPGAGKSTRAKTINATHYETDMYFVDADGVYQFDASKLEQAHQWCRRMTEQTLANGDDVVVSNTFVQRWEMKAYITMAKELGAKLKVIECTGNFGSVHDVPQTTIEQMKKRWQKWQNVPQS
jgi:predicted kinase